MFRCLLAISIACITGCTNPSSKPESPILQKRWAIDTLRYTAYYTSPSLSQNKWNVDITYLLEINYKGRYAIVREAENGQKEYFEGKAPESIMALTEAILNQRTYDTLYLSNPEAVYVYDGDYYLLDYHWQSKRRTIQFIPREAPTEVQRIHRVLDSFVFSNNLTKTDTIILKGYEAEVVRLSTNTTEGPPPTVEMRKFKPPNKKNQSR